MHRVFLLMFALTAPLTLSADYLEVRRNAIMKESPERHGKKIVRLVEDDKVVLLDEGATSNNYYRIYHSQLNRSGWVYRTLVRRRSGEIVFQAPSSHNSSVTSLSGEVARVHFVNVGQGDATLLEFPCGLMMIDAGGRTDAHGDQLVSYVESVMQRSGISEINTIFVTHTHTDHNRSLQKIVENFPVRNYVHNGIYNGSGRHKARWMRDHRNENGRNIHSREVKQAEIAALSNRTGLTDHYIDPLNCTESTDPVFRVISGHYETNTAGWPEGEFENGNNKGIVIRVDYGESSFLFTGDMEEHAIDTLVDFYVGTPMLDVDVYQVGHHGSYNGTNTHLMQAMSPDIAVMSFGPHTVEQSWTAWAYGHPRQVLVNMLDTFIDRQRRSPKTVHIAPRTKTFIPRTMSDAIYGTGWDGTIVIEANASGQMVVRTER